MALKICPKRNECKHHDCYHITEHEDDGCCDDFGRVCDSCVPSGHEQETDTEKEHEKNL